MSAERKSRRKADPSEAVECEPGAGLEKLSQEVNKTLMKNSRRIARALLRSSLDGNVQSTRMLTNLSEGKAAGKGRRRSSAPSVASQLKLEPEWNGAEALEEGGSVVPMLPRRVAEEMTAEGPEA